MQRLEGLYAGGSNRGPGKVDGARIVHNRVGVAYQGWLCMATLKSVSASKVLLLAAYFAVICAYLFAIAFQCTKMAS